MIFHTSLQVPDDYCPFHLFFYGGLLLFFWFFRFISSGSINPIVLLGYFHLPFLYVFFNVVYLSFYFINIVQIIDVSFKFKNYVAS